MRKLGWVVIAVVSLGVVLVGAAALSLNRIIAHNRDGILQQARSTIGRDVAADRIALSLWGGIGVRVDHIRVADDPQFSTSDFAQAAAVIARAKLLPLLRGHLEVDHFDLQQPQIHLIRDASGRWNYQSIGRPTPSSGPESGDEPGATGVSPEQLPFVIGRANIEAGSLSVADRSQNPVQTTTVTQVDLMVGDIGDAAPVHFRLAAAVRADAQNVHVQGAVGPWANPAAIPLQLDGSLGPFGPQKIGIDALRLHAVLTPASLQVSQLDGDAFDGSFKLSGQVPLRGDSEVTLKGELTKIAIAQLLRLSSENAPLQIQGTGSLQLNLHAAGMSPDAIRSSLRGQVAGDIRDAVLKDFNLVNEVLGRLTDLPKIGELVSRNVKPKYSRLFSEPDTRFQTLHATFQIADQRMRTDDLAIVATDYGARAAGWIDFDRETDLSGTLSMSQAFSRDVVADVREAKYLLDEREQLALPFHLRGKLGAAKPQPDTGYLIARLAQGIAPGGVADLLGRLLGTTPGPPAKSKSDEPESALERKLRKLLGR
ncbi:MAG: AsmA family protein [Candidatus Binatia bacterium]